MKKLIAGLTVVVATAAVLVPLATAGQSPMHATGSVDWNYQGTITGHVSFKANSKTGGSLDYVNANGDWIHGVVDAGSYEQKGNIVVFSGTITDGSPGYTIPGTFSAKIIDDGTSGSQGDKIAVLANESVFGQMADVTGGNLSIH